MSPGSRLADRLRQKVGVVAGVPGGERLRRRGSVAYVSMMLRLLISKVGGGVVGVAAFLDLEDDRGCEPLEAVGAGGADVRLVVEGTGVLSRLLCVAVVHRPKADVGAGLLDVGVCCRGVVDPLLARCDVVEVEGDAVPLRRRAGGVTVRTDTGSDRRFPGGTCFLAGEPRPFLDRGAVSSVGSSLSEQQLSKLESHETPGVASRPLPASTPLSLPSSLKSGFSRVVTSGRDPSPKMRKMSPTLSEAGSSDLAASGKSSTAGGGSVAHPPSSMAGAQPLQQVIHLAFILQRSYIIVKLEI